MKLINYFSSILVISILSSCAKEATNNGFSNAKLVTDSSYQPNSSGSFWVYNNSDTNGVLKDSFTVSSTGKDTTINSLPYTILKYDTTYQFQYHVNNKYMFRTSAYTFSSPLGPISFTGFNVDYIDNVNDIAGTQWNFMCVDGGNVSVNTILGKVNVPTNAIGVINNTGTSITINGISYKNVIVSHVDFTALLPTAPGSYSTIQSMDFYTAKGIGVIKVVTYNQSNKITLIQTLKRYSIL